LGFGGTMDTCITIRTIIFKNGKAYVQSGAGIVWDSVPENEYMETINKAKALLKAIRAAEASFGQLTPAAKEQLPDSSINFDYEVYAGRENV
jgi:anthranilate synthase component 1